MSVRSAVAALLLLAGTAVAATAAVRTATPGQNVAVSREWGTQSETAIAIDPSNDEVLLAGSNSHGDRRVHAYGSTDGGATWAKVPLPRSTGTIFSADPAVAIDRTGRQYFGHVRIASQARRITIDVVVAARSGPAGQWRSVAVRPLPRVFDDKPAIAVDTWPGSPHADRVYLAWSRITRARRGFIALSHSDDGGATWSPPVRVSDSARTLDSYASLAVAPDGSVYVAWWNAFGRGVFVDRSTDGGATFGRDRLVDPIAGRGTCSPPGVRIPAQPTNCVRPNPVVSVDGSPGAFAGRVYVTYGDTGGAFQQQDVFVTAFDGALTPIVRRHRVHPPDTPHRADQFWPASAIDQSSGTLWVCFYDTTGDPRRRRTYFSCTRSADGGATWVTPVRAATRFSNVTVPGADTGRRTFGREYGDYQGLAAARGRAHPIWTDTRDLRRLREEVYTTLLVDAPAPGP